MECTCVLNGVKYLSVELAIRPSQEDRLTQLYTKYAVIYQGIKQPKTGGFFYSSYTIIKILVPEANIIAWNKDLLKYQFIGNS